MYLEVVPLCTLLLLIVSTGLAHAMEKVLRDIYGRSSDSFHLPVPSVHGSSQSNHFVPHPSFSPETNRDQNSHGVLSNILYPSSSPYHPPRSLLPSSLFHSSRRVTGDEDFTVGPLSRDTHVKIINDVYSEIFDSSQGSSEQAFTSGSAQPSSNLPPVFSHSSPPHGSVDIVSHFTPAFGSAPAFVPPRSDFGRHQLPLRLLSQSRPPSQFFDGPPFHNSGSGSSYSRSPGTSHTDPISHSSTHTFGSTSIPSLSSSQPTFDSLHQESSYGYPNSVPNFGLPYSPSNIGNFHATHNFGTPYQPQSNAYNGFQSPVPLNSPRLVVPFRSHSASSQSIQNFHSSSPSKTPPLPRLPLPLFHPSSSNPSNDKEYKLSPSISSSLKQQTCRQVPTTVCKQSRTSSHGSDSKMNCQDAHNTVCADVKERNCTILQNLVVKTEFFTECHVEYGRDCQPHFGTKIECFPREDEVCVDKQILKCEDEPRTVTDIVHEKYCSNETTTICLEKYDEVCLPFEEEKCVTNQKFECDVENNEGSEDSEDVPSLVCHLVPKVFCKNFTNPNCTLVPRKVCTDEPVHVCDLEVINKTKEVNERKCEVIEQKECEKEIVQVAFSISIISFGYFSWLGLH